jgi:predicted Zn-dependent protease with MMP-like domain
MGWWWTSNPAGLRNGHHGAGRAARGSWAADAQRRGLYEGIPLTSRTSDYAGVLPDRITIYRPAICAVCQTEQEVADQVRRTVIHEVAHHFGIDDDRLTGLGW